jgi:general secretion pathway protein A
MYLSYYQLETKPFQISTDPKFLWLGEKHKEALAVLRYGVMDNKGFLLLTGEVGTGKTTLINSLVNTLGEEVIVATILDPGLEKEDFFNYICSAFNLPEKFSTKGAFIQQFSAFLNNANQQGKKVLLIIDEAQRLDQVLLEEIRLLSNIEKQSTKLINIFFVGQKEFNNIILEPKNRALRQRITVNYDLKPLNQKESNQYIKHRLKVAGVDKTIFKSASVREIYKFSKGYPRLINVICDRALLTGFAKDEEKITPKIIMECAKELRLREKKGGSTKSPVPEKTKSRLKPETRQRVSKGRFIEKTLYIILAVLITLWIGAAAYFYFPRDYLSDYLGRPVKINQTNDTTSIKKASPRPNVMPPVSQGNHTPVEPSDSPPELSTEKQTVPALFPDRTSIIHIDLTEHNEFSREGLALLHRLATLMNQNREIHILIKGFSGSSAENHRYNKKLSEFTANIIKGFLVGKGVSPQNIETTGVWLVDPEDEKNARDLEPNTRWADIQLQMS